MKRIIFLPVAVLAVAILAALGWSIAFSIATGAEAGGGGHHDKHHGG